MGQLPVAAITKCRKLSGLNNRDSLSLTLEAGCLGSGVGRAALPPEAPGATCCRPQSWPQVASRLMAASLPPSRGALSV